MGDYDFAVDLADFNNTLTYQVRFTPPGRRVLDVGSSTGFLVDALARHRGARVRGVEIDAASAREAQRRGSPVTVGDFTEPDVRERLLEENEGQLFDVVVFGDVLEHLTEPGAALAAARRLLQPSGLVIASIPNVAHGSIRLDLLRGRFRYTAEGLLDRTHVQLFTLASIRALFAGARFQIEQLARSYYPILGTEGRISPGEIPDDIYQYVARDRESWVYQYIVAARMAEWSSQPEPPPGKGDRLHVDVVVEGTPSPELEGFLRRAMPTWATVGQVRSRADVATEPTASSESPPTAVLVLPDDVDVEPRWLHALLDAHRETGLTVGCATIDSRGHVVQAGLSDGAVIGWGDPWPAGPALCADRQDVQLAAPRIGREGEVTADEVTGRFVGRVAARVVRERVRPVALAGLREMFPRSVLILAQRSPMVWDQRIREAFVATVYSLVEAGVTPVVRWSSGQPLDSRLPCEWLERLGVVLFGGDLELDGPAGLELPRESLIPMVSSLAARLQPAVTVVIDDHDEAEVATALVSADTRLVLVSTTGKPSSLQAHAEVVIGADSLERFAERVLALATRDRSALPSTAAPATDHLAALREAVASQAGEGRLEASVCVGVVLSDGAVAASAVTAMNAMDVLHRVVIAERGGLLHTELAAGASPPDQIEVAGIDWSDSGRLKSFIESVDSALVAILDAGDRIVADDLGLARRSLEALSAGVEGISLMVDGQGEVRLVRPRCGIADLCNRRAPDTDALRIVTT